MAGIHTAGMIVACQPVNWLLHFRTTQSFQQKYTAEALKDSYERSFNALNSTNIIIKKEKDIAKGMENDPWAWIIFANDYARDIFGLSPHDPDQKEIFCEAVFDTIRDESTSASSSEMSGAEKFKGGFVGIVDLIKQ